MRVTAGALPDVDTVQVLLVEDNVGDAFLVPELLEEAGADVEVTEDVLKSYQLHANAYVTSRSTSAASSRWSGRSTSSSWRS